MLLNDLHRNFIPLGVLLLWGLPRLPGPGMPAPDGWEWFDYAFGDVPSTLKKDVSPEVQALAFLTLSTYIRLTYKILRLNGTSLLCLRVYHILNDIEGSSTLFLKRSQSKAHTASRLKRLKCLFAAMNYTKSAWNADFRAGGIVFPMFIKAKRNESTTDPIDHFLSANSGFTFKTPTDNAKSRLLQIYRSLESPTLNKDNLDPETEYLIGIIESGTIPAIKTQLYKYQQQSVCKMLQVEMNPDYHQPPHITPITSVVNGITYYVNPTDYTFMKYPILYSAPKGGILAEDMGLGKSLICIALIAATRSQCSNRPDNIFDGEFEGELKEQCCLSLADYSVESIMRNNISWRMYRDTLPNSCVKKLLESPGYYHTRSKFMNRALKHAELSQSPTTVRTSNRSKKSQYSTNLEWQKIWLSCSTLIIVPSTLFDQWRYEIIKHIDHTVVSTLCLSKSKTPIPLPEDLLQYDIVLMSTQRFSLEEKDKSSPLKVIHWKRLIIDEGHTVSSKSRLSDLAKDLYAERRWAVSGTPTPGLTRMTLDSSADSNPIAVQFSEKQELEKLGSIMENFLMVEPWTTHKGLWFKEIVNPFLKRWLRSDAKVQRVLQQLVVRHKENDITTDVVLPPLYRKTVFIEPSYQNKLAINLFTSVINVNAVTSEREDQDFLFNPVNHNELRRLITNLQNASFYWTGFSIQDIQSLYDIANLYLKKMEASYEAFQRSPEEAANIIGTSKRLLTMTQEERDHDKELLNRAMETVNFVRRNKQWLNISKSHEMCYYADSLPTVLHVRAARSASYQQPLILNDIWWQNRSVMMASGSLLVEYKFQMGFFEIDPDLKARLKSGQDSENPLQSYTGDLKPSTPMSALPSKGKARRKQNDTKSSGSTIATKSGVEGFIPTVSKIYQGVNVDDTIMLDEAFTPSRSQSPFATGNECDPESCQLIGTASAKLSYLVSRLIVLSPTEKCIVFYEFDDVAYYIAEALDIIGMKYLIYSNSITSTQRSQYLTEFHINPTFRVLMMNVRLASHGLDVSTASRVFFVNPIWRNDVEAQAIKRAHRIGQRHPVYVETLVLNGTMEEAAITRRRQQHQHADEQDMSENDVIREFLLNHPIMEIDENNQADGGIAPLFLETPKDQRPVYIFRRQEDKPLPAPTSTVNEDSIPLLKSALKSLHTTKRARFAEDSLNSKRVKFA